MGRYAYKTKNRTKKRGKHNKWQRGKSWTKNTYKGKLADKAINTTVEKRMVEIAAEQDLKDSWKISRIGHFKSGFTYPSSHCRPAISNMVLTTPLVLWCQDISTPMNATDLAGTQSKISYPCKLNIKTIQSRLKFYHNGQLPINIRVVMLKINNSGRTVQAAAAGRISADIEPKYTNIPDTSYRFNGIHSGDLKKIKPGSEGVSIIAQEYFQLPAGKRNDQDAAYNVKHVILTKTYKRFLSQNLTIDTQFAFSELANIQLPTSTALTADQAYPRIKGDRIWLVVMTDNPTDGTSFYGTSGMIFNYEEDQQYPTVPVPEINEIIHGQAN